MRLNKLNAEELKQFFERARVAEQSVFAIKGEPPAGATYDDGEPITREINVAWFNEATGERIEIVYEQA